MNVVRYSGAVGSWHEYAKYFLSDEQGSFKMCAVEIRILDLTLAEYLSLEDEFDGKGVSSEQTTREDGKHGALDGVTAIVIVSALALKVLAAWLVKRRSEQEISIEVVRDGSIERTIVKCKSKSEDLNAAVLKQLATLVGPSGMPEGG